ncbi:MAG: DNA repair protein RecO, partial [Mesorhizobium sp.]
PAFLQRGSGLRADPAAIEDAFRLAGFFFSRHVYEPRGIEAPGARAGFLAALRKHHALHKVIGGETVT